MKRVILFIVGLLGRLRILTPLRVAQLKYMYKCRRWPHFRHPRDINEKINWMKFYGDTSLWPLLSDKYRVRSFITEKGFEANLIPLIGKWDDVDQIDWNSLPDQFVLKSNNGSGDVVVCKDKGLMDKNQTMAHFRSILKKTYGTLTGEPHYSLIPPCVIAEQLLDSSRQPNGSASLVDYKIWCFDGEPAYIVCYSNRHDTYYSEIGVYDKQWRSHPEYLNYSAHYQKERQPIPQPSCLDEMLQMATQLSKGHPQVRVDLYVVDGQVYFGELTFSSSGGYMNHFTSSFLNKLGELTMLPTDIKRKKKVLAVASLGGHWIQLLRIVRPMEERYEMVYISTHPKCAAMVEGQRYYTTIDFSRSDAWKLIPAFLRLLRIVWREKPDAIITTGAAPGLVCVFAGWLLRRKTIWIDSMANVTRLSLSGRMASRFVSRTYTQWPHLASQKIMFKGDVL